ncbi:MAG: DUF748 domain-containing protein [Magnetococcales bacterium]|nr:DUF748 domain-containing protein [Magnetococcales bacterium]
MIRIVVFSLVVVCIALALVTLETLVIVKADHYRDQISQMVESLSGHKVRLEKVSYNPLNGLFTLVLTNMEIEASDPGDPPVLVAPTIVLGIRPMSLLLHQPEPVTITLVNPQINIVAQLNHHLIDQAQNKALASDRNMTRELGRGLTGLTLGKIALQNGLLTIVDRARQSDGTLIIDHIHLNLHALSPTSASPLTTSARVHNIPFTLNGQVGPLPASLDPFEMPWLLSLDAKSVGLADLNDMFPDGQIQARLSRGYLSTMIHGTLKTGLQTSSWLQLDGLEWVNTATMQAGKKTSFWKLGVGRTKKDGPAAMDIALRQKSVLRLHRDFRSSLELKEFFIYLDGSPIVETKGRIRGGLYGSWALQFTLIKSVPISQLPIPYHLFLGGGSPTGKINVKGSWPEGGDVQAQLDFSPTSIQLPPLVKGEGLPLKVDAKADFSESRLQFKEAHIIAGDEAAGSVSFKGAMVPALDMTGSGQGDLTRLSKYFPILASWQTAGKLELEQVQIGSREGLSPDRLEGHLRVSKGKAGPVVFDRLEAPFRWRPPEWRFSQVTLEVPAGRADAFVSILAPEERPPTFTAMVVPVGVFVEKLPLPRSGLEQKLEGLLFGNVTVHGVLDGQKLPDLETLTAHGTLRMPVGRITSLDPAILLKQPSEEITIAKSGKSWTWDQARAEIQGDARGIRLENMKIRSLDSVLTGRGNWQFGEKYGFDIEIANQLPPWGETESFLIHVAGDDITQGLRMSAVNKTAH